MDSVSDAENAAVSIDGGNKRRRYKRRKSGKGPKSGIALVQSINQADLSLKVGNKIQGMDVDPAAGLNAECSSNIFSTTQPLEKSQKTVPDAANAAVSIDKAMPEAKVDLGSGKQRRKKKKGPKSGIALEQNIHQANQSLEVEDRIQGNIMDVDSAAGLNALEKSQKTVLDAADATVSIDKGMPQSKVDLGSGKQRRKKGPKSGISSVQNINQANQSLEDGDRIQGNFMDVDSAAGLNALEKSQKTVLDAANATVGIDKGTPQSTVDLGSGKRRRKKGPKFGISSVQNINQANQSLEVGDRIQGNFMDVDSAAGLNALEKSQKTVLDAVNAAVSIDKAMPEAKVDLGSGKQRRKKKKGPKSGIALEQNINQANQSLEVEDKIQGNIMDVDSAAGLNALEKSQKTVLDAVNAAVSIDKAMPEAKVDLGSGKQRRKKKKGPKSGIALEQNIHQANQSLEVEDRIQGNFMEVDSAAGLNALEKSQKTVLTAADATVSINKGMPQSKVDLGSGKRRRKKGPKFGISSVQNINQANQSLEDGDRIQGNFMEEDSAAGLNAELSSNILSTAHPLEKCQKTVQSRMENKADSTNGSFDLNHKSVSQQESRFFAKKESSLPIEQLGVKGPSEFVFQGVSNGANSGFCPRPFAPAVYSRSHQYLSASEFLHGEQLLHWDVPYGENSCFVPRPFVPSVSRRSEQHVSGVEGSQMMYWDASYGTNLCSVPRSIAPIVSSRKKLLVLDINGLLADIVMPSPKGRRADKHILGRAVFKRPFYYEFLVFCCERFDVGIWSSRSKKVIDKLVDYLLGDLQTKLLFCWNMLQCTETTFKTLENKHKPLVFKELRKLWEKDDPSLPWERGYYNESNTVLLDDSPYKALLNPINTAIFPRSFQYKDKKNKSLGPGGDLRVYLEGLAATDDDVRKFIAQHPFGQGAIDARSRLWGFYSKVLHSCSAQDAQKC